MTLKEQQKIIREGSPIYLGLPQAVIEPRKVKGQMTVPGPSTLSELAEALRNPLPPKPPVTGVRDALEAFKNWQPLTLERVRELMAEEREARDKIMADYRARTGQAVDYCDACELGVAEEEVEEGWGGTRVESHPCEECDGLGVITL